MRPDGSQAETSERAQVGGPGSPRLGPGPLHSALAPDSSTASGPVLLLGSPRPSWGCGAYCQD